LFSFLNFNRLSFNISRSVKAVAFLHISFVFLLMSSISHSQQNPNIQRSADWLHLEVKQGDNLSTLFSRAGLSAQEVLKVSNATSDAGTFVRMIPGETLSLLIRAKKVAEIEYWITTDTYIHIVKSTDTNLFQITQRIRTTNEPKESKLTPSPSVVTASPSQNSLSPIDITDFSAIERTIIEVTQSEKLNSVFTKAGLNAQDVTNIINASTDKDYFKEMQNGDNFNFLIVDNELLQLEYSNSDSKVAFTRDVKLLDTYTRSDSSPSSGNTSQLIEENPIQALLNTPTSETDNWIYYNVLADDNLSTLFIRAGLSHTDVHYVDKATNEEKIFSRMQVGEKLAFLIRSGELIKVKYIINPLKSVLVTRTDKTDYIYETLERSPVKKQVLVGGQIKNSLYIDALNAGLTSNLTMNFAKVFSWDVDFSQDLQPGDEFQVVYEQLTIDGSKIKDGNILAAQFKTGGQNLIGIFYRDSQGDVGFYTPDGRSMRKAFLRMPVEFARISSKFNPRRRHPVSNKIRAHKGVDYAAKTGTPIMASGNGKIIFRGRKNGYGNTIIIQHGSDINTLYAHMSGFNKDFKTGSRVQQGQVIGYVGATGLVTGAHLHYEFRVSGVHKNPLTVKLDQAERLPDSELENFKQVAAKVMTKFKSEETIASKKPNSNL